MEYKNTIQVLDQYGDRVRLQMIENLQENGSNNTGTLAKSITYRLSIENLSTTIDVNAWYGIVLEDGIGRKSGRIPPLIPIQNWIRRKNLRPKPGTTVEQFAFAIARKIAKSGTNPKPKPFAAPAVASVKQSFGDQAIAEGYGKDLEININEQFKLSGAKIS